MEKSCPKCGQAIATIEGLEIDQERGEIRYGGSAVYLARHQFRLFEALAERPGRCLSKEMLSNAVYFDHRGGERPGDKIIDVFVCHIRKAIKPLGLSIKTVWGRGHELVMPGVKSMTDIPITTGDMATIQYGGPTS